MISDKLKLDDIDRKIISLVQENPDMTHTQIAEKIERSQPTVGMRIKKLEKSGVLQFQPGINFKKVELFLATVELNTKDPDIVMDMAKCCPFMLNAFRVSGEHNVCVLLACSNLQKLENVVNYHFRGKPDIGRVSMEVVTEIANDLIMPIDFDSEHHEPTLENGCGEKCKYLIAKKEGRI
ncbi:MAG: Lrp/AsnC family transcriptional regulator [Candidatus Thorarchaeota archaeon]